MHLAARSRSTSKKLRQQSATCEACGIVSDLFLAILSNIEPVRHYIICLDCYQRDTWQTKINLKELTTKTGLLNGSQESASKQRKYPSFPSPFTVLKGRDIAFYKRKIGKPQTLVILSGEEFEKLMEKDNESNTTKI